jgi:NTP pyrophosphatase (non-canonical NTP hydrolase)
VKKAIRDHGGRIDEDRRKALSRELGDVLWYVAEIATHLGLDLGDVAANNTDKLLDRKDRGVLDGSGDDR